MTRAKSSAAYGQDMLQISFMRAEQFPLRLPFGDRRLAMAWRLSFYSFRSALKREGDPRFAAVAPLQIRIDDTGDALVEHVDNSAATALVLAALGAGPSAPPVAPTPSSPPPAASPFGMDAVDQWLSGTTGGEKKAISVVDDGGKKAQ